MGERHTRGYSILGAMSYIDATYDEATSARIYDDLPLRIRTAMHGYNRIAWYPIDEFSAFLRAIARAEKDEPKAIEAVAACGAAIATEATNTFLKLLMRMLTPVLFAKKFERFWARDHDFGTLSSDVSRADEGVIRIRIADVEGYDFVGPIGIGYMRYAMSAMGKQDVKVDLEGWSLANPGPRELDFTLTWAV